MKLLLAVALASMVTACSAAPEIPYPRSDLIRSITFDRDTLKETAGGSDIWSTTWGGNGELFATRGDGGGFGGSDSKGRVSFGVAAITGAPPDWSGFNLWGGVDPKSKQPPALGKGVIMAAGDRLYLYVSEQGQWDRARLWKSTDFGLNWSDRGWIFPHSHKVFAFPAIVEFGRAQSLNKDGYVYGLSDNDPKRGQDSKLYLFRVPRERIEDLSAYEYFSGTAQAPAWSGKVEDRRPVFENSEGIGWGTTCVFHPATQRFLLSASIHAEKGNWGMYEGEHPWGPWKTIAYGSDFPEWTCSPAQKNRPAYLHTFPGKWMSADGRTAWCIFDRGDHLNVARCTLEISAAR